MFPQRVEGTGNGHPYNPYAHPQQAMNHPATNLFQQHAPQFPYYQPPMPMQMVSVWQTPIIGYRTEMVQGLDGSCYPQNVPVYGQPRLVTMPVPVAPQYPPVNYPYPQPTNYPYPQPIGSYEEVDETKEETAQDLDLPLETVGHALELKSGPVAVETLTTTNPDVDAFFEPKVTAAVAKPLPQKKRTPEQLLQQFVTNAKSGSIAVDRADYRQMISAYEQDKGNQKKWEDAMQHDVPQKMLQNLDQLHYFVKPQAEEKKKGRTTFLFPCSIALQETKGHGKIADNKDRMCLELTLLNDGTPIHLFLRHLKQEDNYRDRVLGENREEVEQKLHEGLYPSLETAKNFKETKLPLSKTNPVADDGVHLTFWSSYGVKIKAEKK